ncbi:MAG TPA: hypothetical protein VED40_23290 [Azospirillaceae bacterium]|nr:hypothetical protein [Azospirillaceae bacterium]
MTPYAYPTTLLAVDDDPLFLESLAFRLSPGLRCEGFVRPAEALAELARRAACAGGDDLLAPLDPADMCELPGDVEDRAIRAQLNRIRRLAGNADRMREVSVVVADYDMPGMDGVQLFRAIRDLPCLKVLLTGKADERVAVAAFNEGLIDRFVPKHDATAPATLRDLLDEAAERYFQRRTRTLGDILRACGSFVLDPDFEAYFADVKTRRRVTEHYLCTEVPGLLCGTRDGDAFFLLVQDQEAIVDNRHYAVRQGAPAEILAAMQAPDRQLWPEPDPDGSGRINWRLFAAERVGCDGRLACSIIPVPAEFAGFQPGSPSLARYSRADARLPHSSP